MGNSLKKETNFKIGDVLIHKLASHRVRLIVAIIDNIIIIERIPCSNEMDKYPLTIDFISSNYKNMGNNYNLIKILYGVNCER